MKIEKDKVKEELEVMIKSIDKMNKAMEKAVAKIRLWKKTK